ncbi:MAG: threonine/serine exporter family protein [Oscillospiraceae bacterium]|nr:threonine/serine exporter family protein [Oscillospiraceae bacterium]
MEFLIDWVLPCISSFFACIGFCFVFNIHGPGMIICGGGGALGWLVYLLAVFATGSEILRFLLAAIAITVYSEIMARVRRCPVTSYLIIALLPLVPGGGIYEAMRCCVQGDTALFLAALVRTFGIAGALALGALLGSSIFRILSPSFYRTQK